MRSGKKPTRKQKIRLGNAVGATWKQKDVFGYDVFLDKLEQIKRGD